LPTPNATVLAGDVVRYDFTLNDTVPPLGVFLTATNSVMVWWASVPLGWSLVGNTDSSSTNWVVPSQTVKTNGTNKFIITPSASSGYCRLKKSG
jgi:hypothetical protein